MLKVNCLTRKKKFSARSLATKTLSWLVIEEKVIQVMPLLILIHRCRLPMSTTSTEPVSGRLPVQSTRGQHYKEMGKDSKEKVAGWLSQQQ